MVGAGLGSFVLGVLWVGTGSVWSKSRFWEREERLLKQVLRFWGLGELGKYTFGDLIFPRWCCGIRPWGHVSEFLVGGH